MADLKLVGAVAIKVRPDATGFRKDTQDKLNQELKKVEGKVKATVEVDADTKAAEAKIDKVGDDAEGKVVTLKVGLDHDSVVAAQKQFEKLLKDAARVELEVDLKDPADIDRIREELAVMKEQAKVEMTYINDEKGYQAVLEKINALRREKLELPVEPFFASDEELDRLEEEFRQKIADATRFSVSYTNDKASLEKAVKDIEAELAKLAEVTTLPIDLNKEDLEAARDLLQDEIASIPTTLKVNYDDQASLKSTRDKLQSMLNDVLSTELEVLVNEDDIRAKLAEINDLIEEEVAPVEVPAFATIRHSNDRASLKAAMDQVKRELDKIRAVTFNVNLNEDELDAKLAELELRYANTPIELKYAPDADGYQQVLNTINEELRKLKAPEIPVELALDEAGLRAQELEFRRKLAEATRNPNYIKVELERQSANKVEEDHNRLIHELSGKQVELGINLAGTELTAARLAFLGRDRMVTFFANVNTRSLAVAEGALKSLGGLNVLGNFTSMLERMFTNFDEMASKASNIAVVLGNVANLLLTSTASVFSIGEGVSKSLGLLAAAPGILGAATVGYTIFTAAFNNFFDAFNKDPKIAESALAALPPIARKTVDSITGLYKGLANPIQEKFWEHMGGTLAETIETLYPSLKEKLLESTEAVGDFVGGMANSFNKLALSDDFDRMFAGFNGFFTNLSGASEPFFDAWNKFGVAGAQLLPQFGTWLTNLAIQFDQWATKMSANGGIERMIMDGVNALSAMWRVGVDVIDIFDAIAGAAQRAGIGGLGEFEQGLRKIADKMNGEPWQSRAALIFEGARKGTEGLMGGFRDLSSVIGDSADEVGNILNLLGQIGGAVITNLATLIDDQGFQNGVTVGLEGMLKMMQDINPAARSLGDIIGNLATIAGAVFSTMGPTVSRFFGTVEQVVDKLAQNLAEVAPKLSNTIGAIFAAATPAVLLMAEVLNMILTVVNKVPDSFVLAGVAATAFFALRGLASKFFESLSGTSHFKQLEQNWVNSQISAGKYATSLQLVDGEMKKVTTLHNQFSPTKAVFNDLTTSVGGTVTGIRDMYRIASSAEVGLSPLNAAWKTGATVAGNFFKTVGTGLMGALGGPWGLAISAAAIGVGIFAQGQADAAAKAEALTATLDKQTGAITAASNAMIADNIMKQSNNGFYLLESGAKSASETINALGMKVKDTADIVANGGQPYDDMIALLEEGKVALDAAGISFDENGFMVEGNGAKLDAWAKKMKISKDAVKSMDLLGLITFLQGERGALDNSQSAWDTRNATLSTADQRVEDFNSAMRIYNDETLTADQRTRGLKDALDLLNGKQLTLDDQIQKVNDSMRNMGGSMQAFTEVNKETGETITVMKKVGGAFRDAQGNVKDFNGVIDATTGRINTVGEAGSVLDTMLQTTTDATIATVTKMKDAGKGLPEITQYLADQRQAFIDLGVEAGLDAALVGKAYDYMIGANPKDLITTITAQGVEDAKTRIESYKGTLDQVDAYKAVAEIAGDDTILGEKLANSYTSLGEFDKAIATATADLDPTAADAVRVRILQDLVDLAATNPTVAANMDPKLLDEALRVARGNLDSLHRMKPTPEVRAEIADAEANIRRIQGLINGVQGKDVTITITQKYLQSGNPVAGAGQVYVDPMNSANGNILRFQNNIAYKAFANGGIERHVAQIARPGVTPRVWAEKETYGEAYIPYAQSKRPRSLAILSQVAKDFGYELSKASEGFANGGFAGHAGPSTTNSASVNIGNLYTVDADEAVRKIRNSQADALAVAGITLTGA